MSFHKDFSVVSGLSPDPRVHIFRSLFSAPGEFDNMTVDAYALVTERFLILCDTLLCPEDMQKACAHLEEFFSGRQLLVINSHADWDHVWGTQYLAERYASPIIGHQQCRTRLLSTVETEILREYQEKFEVFRSVVLVSPTLTFQEQLTIQGGDLTLELFTAFGHQYDQIAGWVPEIRLLLAFDALEYPLPGIATPEMVPVMFRTLESFQRLQPANVLCSHGNLNTPDLIEQNLNYLREIERRCRLILEHLQLTEEQQEDPSYLIDYPFSEVVADVREPIDSAYYEHTHKENIRFILSWLTKEAR